MNDHTTRRGFLGHSALAAAGTWAGAQLFATGAAAQSSPNSTITMGVIGCGARARQVVKNFLPLPGVRFVAACDVNSKNLDSMQKMLGGSSIAAHHDFRKLLDDKSIDAVLVGTNAHWHVIPTMMACQAGKDVYVEKPLANSIAEGRFAVRAARKYNRIVQIGTQQRSREHYRKACELIQSGALGTISEVKVWDYENWTPGRGSPADCAPPPELDWDFYVGPAPMQPYNPNIYYNYGYDWFKLSGGGHQVAWGVHHLDVVQWAMGVRWPSAVAAAGGKYAFPDDNRQWPDTFSAVLEYGPGPVAKNGFLLQYSMRIGCRREQRSHGKCFYGTDAVLQLDRSRFTLIRETAKGRKKVTVEEEETLAAEDEPRHAEVFLENVRSRKQPFADVEVGHWSTNACHLMNVAWQAGRKIRWDGEKEQVIDDPQANAFVSKPYRAPWKLEL